MLLRLYTLLHVVACGCVMLGVVERSLKPVKLLSQQLLKFLFFRDRRRVAQQCSIGLHSSSNIVEATHAHWHCFTKSYGLHPSHDGLRFLTLLEVVASVYQYLYRICPCSRADINGGPDEWPKKNLRHENITKHEMTDSGNMYYTAILQDNSPQQCRIQTLR